MTRPFAPSVAVISNRVVLYIRVKQSNRKILERISRKTKLSFQDIIDQLIEADNGALFMGKNESKN